MANKILWFLWANPSYTASARLQGLQIHQHLKKLGYASELAYIPTSFERTIPFSPSLEKSLPHLLNVGDRVILQKCKDTTNFPIIEFFKKLGATVILVDCDLPIAEDIGKVVDRVICSSELLREAYSKLNATATFIEDAPERFEERTLFPDKHRLTCVWFGDGSGHRWQDVQKLKTLFQDPRLSRWELITISNNPDATIEWHPDYLNTICKIADVVALPVFNRDEANAVKSANRLLQSMALSIPTICSPILSYQTVAESSKGVIVCETDEDWVNAFLFFESTTNRKEYSESAFQSAQRYSLERRIPQWIEALHLTDAFKSKPAAELAFTKINHLFYLELIKKNIRYFTRVPFSGRAVLSAFYYFFKRIRK